MISYTVNSGSSVTVSDTWFASSGTSLSPIYLDAASEWAGNAGTQFTGDVDRLRDEWEASLATQRVQSGTLSNLLRLQDQFFALDPLDEDEARRFRELEYEQDRANWRAEELLTRNLSRYQRESYEEHGRFKVKTHRGHYYWIGKAKVQNVLRVNRRGTPMRVYCLRIRDRVPLGDTLLAQKLLLETDEDQFLEVAFQWPVRFGAGLGDLIRKKKKDFSPFVSAAVPGEFTWYETRTRVVA